MTGNPSRPKTDRGPDYSLHVDVQPGDRANACRAPMRPVALDHNSKKGFQIVHECLACGARKRNRAAVDTVQPDRLIAFMGRLAAVA